MSETLGKIDRNLVEDFIKEKSGSQREDVLVGPGFGVDVSLIDIPGNMAMAMTSDPLSLIPTLGLKESAWLSVQLMANDMATTGFAPMFGQFVLNLPASFSKKDFQTYWDHIHHFCEKIGMAITGGHTGFIEGQNSTIAGGGTFTTIAPKDKIKVSKYAQKGDSILVTKSCAISSSAILAMSFPETVKNRAGAETYHRTCETFYDTSSLKEALTVMETSAKNITGMHDVTEGGVLGAIYEMAVASGNGAIVNNEKIPIGHLQKAVCDIFSLDPRYCIGAGSMIISCKPGSDKEIIESLKYQGIQCSKVGEFTDADSGIQLTQKDEISKMKYYETDPYWAAFFKALNAGWK
ncbi:AIR synthase-related protein [Gramella jeungdoensis]|uniref:AIR synthase-related protein n=1 Tax=Gramella jeungdoensis TaxID=708091 RepID=A0ABT0Z248_9FLAO|nr:AIR synthase-related protein [Gramella jeungdoensis]MCM8569816.1 AIR synthase-related protein [Gramella jeungdoensis]